MMLSLMFSLFVATPSGGCSYYNQESYQQNHNSYADTIEDPVAPVSWLHRNHIIPDSSVGISHILNWSLVGVNDRGRWGRLS